MRTRFAIPFGAYFCPPCSHPLAVHKQHNGEIQIYRPHYNGNICGNVICIVRRRSSSPSTWKWACVRAMVSRTEQRAPRNYIRIDIISDKTVAHVGDKIENNDNTHIIIDFPFQARVLSEKSKRYELLACTIATGC